MPYCPNCEIKMASTVTVFPDEGHMQRLQLQYCPACCHELE